MKFKCAYLNMWNPGVKESISIDSWQANSPSLIVSSTARCVISAALRSRLDVWSWSASWVKVRNGRNNAQRELPVTRWWFQLGEIWWFSCIIGVFWNGINCGDTTIAICWKFRLMLICKYHDWCNAFLAPGWMLGLTPPAGSSYHDVRLLLAKQILHVRTVFFVTVM